MENKSLKISNKTVAYNGAVVAVATVFAYSSIVMIYTIIRSSVTIYSIMPKGERNTIILDSSFSVAYSVVIFSLVMAALSSVTGSVAAVILKNSLLRFNPGFSLKKAILISCITAFAIVILMYLSLHALLKNWMTLDYAETLMFWFLIPAAIFIAVSIVGGSKINKALETEINEVDNISKKISETKFKSFRKYFINCLLLTIPILVWDFIFTDKLPKAFQPEVFWSNIPSFLTYGENISRINMFVLICLMPLRISTSLQRKGLALYVAGTLIYFASWIALMYFPNSIWSKSVLGTLAPAYTPLFWLIGIGLIADSLYFAIPYKRWLYFLVVIIFLIFHTLHTYLIYFRTH